MEPEISKPNMNQEVTHANYENNVDVKSAATGVELGVENGAEAFEQASELAARAADSATNAKSFILPSPVLPIVDDSSTVVATGLDDAPIAANDEDLIEKEWVDRAKKIINETKTDPYKREEAVNKLQRDYQKKRYGRELGDV